MKWLFFNQNLNNKIIQRPIEKVLNKAFSFIVYYAAKKIEKEIQRRTIIKLIWDSRLLEDAATES